MREKKNKPLQFSCNIEVTKALNNLTMQPATDYQPFLYLVGIIATIIIVLCVVSFIQDNKD